MTDLLQHLRTRRTIPAAFLGGPAPSEAQIRELLTMATRVPDHGKLAPWRFILFEGEARTAASEGLLRLRLDRDPNLPETDREADRIRLAQAPVVIAVVSRAAVHPKIPVWEQQLSAGAVAMNLIHAAFALGFAAQWLTGWPVYDAEAARFLGLHEGETLAGFVHVGTPTVPPQDRPRPDVDGLTTRWSPPA